MVLTKTGGRYGVYCDGLDVEASLRGRLKQGSPRVLVGDVVTIHRHSDDSVTIEAVRPQRRTGTGVEELNADADATTGPPHAPAHDELCAQLG